VQGDVRGGDDGAVVWAVEERIMIKTLQDHEMREHIGLLGFLKQIPLFVNFPDPAIEQITKELKYHKYRMREVVLKKGAMPEGLFLIKSGRVKVIFR